jgi:aspartate/methionine/tyrosine aminotransferase
MFSERSRCGSGPNRLGLALEAARIRGQALIDLTESNPTRASIPYAHAEILSALSDPRGLGYSPEPLGLESARDAVAATLGSHAARLGAGRVVLTASTSEAYAHLFKLLCDPGDEVLIPAPSYPLFEYLARFENVVAVPYRLVYDGAWHIDVDSLRRARSERTRALVIVTPNNPTGSFVSRDELAVLSDLGIPIVSDEVFSSYAFDDDPRRIETALEATDALVFALGGLSKLAALPQLKLGWMVVGGPDRLARPALERLELVADAYLSVSTPVQLALPRLLETRGVAEGAIHERIVRNWRALGARIDGTAVTRLHAAGGWYAVLRLPTALPEEEWALELLTRDSVSVHPGYFYDFSQEPFVVVSLLTAPDAFDAGIGRIVERVHSVCG